MYPYITLFDTQIHMTGLGIIIWILTFLWTWRKYASKYQLNRAAFAKHIPLYLIGLYLLAQYVWYFFSDFTIIPTSGTDIMSYLSPNGYTLHLVWILVWWIAIARRFLRSQNAQQRHWWIATRLLSTLWWCIPLWLLLLLWDHFIGSPANRGISAFHADSKLAGYDTVIPLGLILSTRSALVLWLMKYLRTSWDHPRKFAYLWRAIFLFGISTILLFQEYPRHLVFTLGKTRDIKNYVLLILAWYFLWQHTKIWNKEHLSSPTVSRQV